MTLKNFRKPLRGPFNSEHILRNSYGFNQLTPEQIIFFNSVRDFSKTRLLPRIVDLHTGKAKFKGQIGHRPSEILGPNDIIDLTDYHKVGVDEKYGGDGGDIIYQCIMHYWLAYGSPSAAAVDHGISLGLGFKYAATEDQKTRIIPDIMNGKSTICFGLTGTECGSDPFAQNTLKFTYDKESNLYVLNGKKTFITGAPNSDIMLAFAKGEDGRTTAFLVNRKKDGIPGFTTGPVMDKTGWRGSDTSEVFCDDVPVKPENLVGEVGNAGQLVNLILSFGRLKMAWDAYAIIAAILDLTSDNVRQRRAAGGGKQVELQILHNEIGVLLPKIRAVRDNLFTTTFLANSRDAEGMIPFDFADAATSAKIFATNTLQEVGDKLEHWFGGMRHMNDYIMAVYNADRRLYTTVEGDNGILEISMGRQFVMEPKK